MMASRNYSFMDYFYDFLRYLFIHILLDTKYQDYTKRNKGYNKYAQRRAAKTQARTGFEIYIHPK